MGIVDGIDAIARELTLFAAIGFLVGGIDDLMVDLVWMAGRVRAGFAPDPLLAHLARPARPTRFAIFVAAWREEAVIGAMLRTALSRIDHPDYRIYVGAYPNDPGTIAAIEEVAATDARVRLVIGHRDGPTTKADNLNTIWRAMRADQAAGTNATEAIVIHDAEDVIHADELAVHEAMLVDADVVQVPVVPLIHPHGRFVSGVYADEFAESHSAFLPVRSSLGAGLPLAGVGCAVRVAALARLARAGDARVPTFACSGDNARLARAGDAPFESDSICEDYELGLRLAEAGCRARFARVRAQDGTLIATRAYFPQKVDASARQKARWMVGIALAGWDRIGWARPLALSEHWMRMRDRRAPLAVLVLAAAYFAFVVSGAARLAHRIVETAAPAYDVATWLLLQITAALLVWRMALRAWHTARVYGWAEGLRSIPRIVVANFISLLAVRRALWRYVEVLRGGVQRWDKTEHAFPDLELTGP